MIERPSLKITTTIVHSSSSYALNILFCFNSSTGCSFRIGEKEKGLRREKNFPSKRCFFFKKKKIKFWSNVWTILFIFQGKKQSPSLLQKDVIIYIFEKKKIWQSSIEYNGVKLKDIGLEWSTCLEALL